MSKQKKSNYKNPASATWEGIRAVFSKQEKAGSLSDSDRLDGKTVLVDGASSGLGFAVAVQMAQRGARVFMVNYLSKFIMINGLIREDCFRQMGKVLCRFSPSAADPENGKKLWRLSEELVNGLSTLQY